MLKGSKFHMLYRPLPHYSGSSSPPVKTIRSGSKNKKNTTSLRVRFARLSIRKPCFGSTAVPGSTHKSVTKLTWKRVPQNENISPRCPDGGSQTGGEGPQLDTNRKNKFLDLRKSFLLLPWSPVPEASHTTNVFPNPAWNQIQSARCIRKYISWLKF